MFKVIFTLIPINEIFLRVEVVFFKKFNFKLNHTITKRNYEYIMKIFEKFVHQHPHFEHMNLCQGIL